MLEGQNIAKFTKTELREYEDSLKAYRDIKNSLDTAMEQGFEKGREEGRAEGREEGRAEGADQQKLDTARMMLDNGEPVDKIALYTGLAHDEIENMRR